MLVLVAIVGGGIAVHQAQAITAYAVSYTAVPEVALDAQGDLLEGESDTHSFDVDAQNLSAVRLKLDWDDAVGAADRFSVTLTAPNGSAWEATDNQPPVNLDVPVHAVPMDHAVYALDVRTARALMPVMLANAEATGTWTAVVRLVSAPGEPGMLGEGIDGVPDGEQSYTLTVERIVWRAVIEA